MQVLKLDIDWNRIAAYWRRHDYEVIGARMEPEDEISLQNMVTTARCTQCGDVIEYPTADKVMFIHYHSKRGCKGAP